MNTSLHGVSDWFVSEAFRRAKLPHYVPVEQQQLPDPDFPTVKFPNPEEKGMSIALVNKAMMGILLRCLGNPEHSFTIPTSNVVSTKDLAIATATRYDASYVLAQDPDADRFSAAERGYSVPFHCTRYLLTILQR